MRGLIAFDKFKDSMSAEVACEVAAEALLEAHPDWILDRVPLTDGGEGFARILTTAAGGRLDIIQVTGPRFHLQDATLGWVRLEVLPESARALLQLPPDGALAVIEMAQASGLQALEPGDRDPWKTSTYGTGELIRYATRAGAAAILLGIGGSATNDLGLGALEALGLELRGDHSQHLRALSPERWHEIREFDGQPLEVPPVRIACDVDNPLLGKQGATATFGPQKGLKLTDLQPLEHLMEKTAHRLLDYFGHPREQWNQRLCAAGSGAAGGIGFGLQTALRDARFVPGFPLVAAWLRLEEKRQKAHIILTGEGRFDLTSLHGKGPAAVLEHIRSDQSAYLFAGSITKEARAAMAGHPGRRALTAIAPDDWPLERCLCEGPNLLRKAVKEVVLD